MNKLLVLAVPFLPSIWPHKQGGAGERNIDGELLHNLSEGECILVAWRIVASEVMGRRLRIIVRRIWVPGKKI